MREGYGLGNKLVNRIGLNLSNEYNNKLKKLAISCNLKPTELARHIVESMLDDYSFVNQLQEERNTVSAYRILLINKNGKRLYEARGKN
jgi:hypothetical protein